MQLLSSAAALVAHTELSWPSFLVGYTRDFLFLKVPFSLFIRSTGRLLVFAGTMSSGHEPVYPEYETETSQTSKLLRKFKETPFVPIGELKFGCTHVGSLCMGDHYGKHGPVLWMGDCFETTSSLKWLPRAGLICGKLLSAAHTRDAICCCVKREINEASYLNNSRPRTSKKCPKIFRWISKNVLRWSCDKECT